MTTGDLTEAAVFAGATRRAALAAAEPTQRFGSFFLTRFLGLDITYDDEEQTCTVVLPYARFLGNPQGSVHGGIIATAMDISMGHLCHRHFSASVTVDINLRYFRPLNGAGRCVGRVLKPGRRLLHLESRLHDESERLVAHATSTWHRLDAPAQ